MRILISNDDGYQAPGIEALVAAIREVAERVTVVAPERNRSAASNSLTVQEPLRVFRAANGFLYVNGTPSDCVHLALSGDLLDHEPEMVISGINSGANLADDVIYSGTVAAAMEGRFLGYPAIAVSLCSSRPEAHYDTAARVAQTLVRRIQRKPLPADTILNVNVPDLPWSALAGWKVTRLGNRHKAEPVTKIADPRGAPLYWIGQAGGEQDCGPGTDFHAINSRCVSITPLKIDLTRYEALESLQTWLGDGSEIG
jgi:5'-nucleotidase